MLTNGSSNTAHYSDPAYDKLIASAVLANSEDARSAIYQQAEQQLDKDSAIVPVYYYVNARLVKPYVGGYTGKDPLDNVYVKDLYIIKH
jgi:oligopeptide transport system substrate-binding protein